MLAVVAIGGNALIRDRAHEAIPDQFQVATQIAASIVAMVEAGWNVVLTHGNGPQIGFILRRSELAAKEMPPVSMDYAGADIQGSVGWMFVRALRNGLRRRGLAREAVAIVTQTIVDPSDAAFARPSKPIGSQMEEAKAKSLAARLGWTVREDAGRGWRRVVPSPLPKAIVETAVIRDLLAAGYIVVACGGGGIPVVEEANGDLKGVEAVIDKDFASGLLARDLRADALVLETAVEQVALDFNKPSQRWVDRMSVADARRYCAEGQFAEGSMAPKIAASIDFVSSGGKFALITNAASLPRALRGETGTRISK